MTHTLQDLFGTNATEDTTAGTVTINLDDFVDSAGNPLLANPTTAEPDQKAAAWLSWLHRTQTPALDDNGQSIVDKTQAIVPQTSFIPKTFEVREGETQIKHEFNFAIYAADNSTFDPDNV